MLLTDRFFLFEHSKFNELKLKGIISMRLKTLLCIIELNLILNNLQVQSNVCLLLVLKVSIHIYLENINKAKDDL